MLIQNINKDGRDITRIAWKEKHYKNYIVKGKYVTKAIMPKESMFFDPMKLYENRFYDISVLREVSKDHDKTAV